jgi:hypothetical protein
MNAARILESLLIAALLSCASAQASEVTGSTRIAVSELRCNLVQGQVRCTFGS